MSVDYRAAIFYGNKITDEMMSHLSSEDAFEEVLDQGLIHYTDGYNDSGSCILGFRKRQVSEEGGIARFEFHDLETSWKEDDELEKAWNKLFPDIECPYADYFLALVID